MTIVLAILGIALALLAIRWWKDRSRGDWVERLLRDCDLD